MVVGIAGTVSTTVAGGQIWRRMGAEKRLREKTLAKLAEWEKAVEERERVEGERKRG